MIPVPAPYLRDQAPDPDPAPAPQPCSKEVKLLLRYVFLIGCDRQMWFS